MSDKLIKASDAVDIVAKHSALYGDGEINTDDGEALLYDIMSEIMNLPSAQPEPQWIPVSEMLPDKRQMVIIWLSIPKQPFEKRSMHMAMAWREPDARTGELHWMDRHFLKIMDEKVVAWMPLPEPYNEGDSDENDKQ